ncbi:protein phosphatase 2C domain-containing protein [Asanoa siamensis]|uniref:PPM-type phosphatase domain-containing protein n=1 Tax=Asanoa siamensis TaxID=926357 RepID=A0ABQ4CJ30_9ACTN|nr:protein phosphatase 2C domain-containing protein [Asanoa siamensis]GIF70973.1 hypothetical protein Asi02nite_04910 [Asanoa siamensis]
MRAALATSPAKDDHPNEDFAAAIPGAAILLDGAGLSGTRSTCHHGVAWFTRRLGGALVDLLSTDGAPDLRDVLAAGIGSVADAHRATCDVADPSSPSATVVLLRLAGPHVDYLVLADSVLVLDLVDGEPLVVSDDREAIVGRRYRSAMDNAANDTPEHDAARRTYVEALRAHRNQPGGFWVAADNPSAAAEALTGSVPVREMTSAALLSDGASRIADRFHLADWSEVLRLLSTDGPTEVINRVRDAERKDPDGKQWPRGKTHDDATIAYLTDLAG